MPTAAGRPGTIARIRTEVLRATEPAALLEVRVPATSANLGAGYDAFGVALDLPLRAWAVPRRDRRIILGGFGADELPEDHTNLVWRALEVWCDDAGLAPAAIGADDVSLIVASAIPLEGGMGSSSAAAVAGMLLAAGLAARAGFSGGARAAADLLHLAVALEGHPDNAAAALRGGLVNCVPAGPVVRVTPSSALRPVLLWPAARQATAAARQGLPAQIASNKAAANASRAAATFAALAGLAPLDARMMVDGLHEPARLQSMATSGALIRRLRAEGIAACLSGAGPSVLAVVPTGASEPLSRLAAIAAAEAAAVEVVPSSWDLAGATLQPARLPRD